MLQKLKIVQTPSHHNQHHRKGKDTHYCVLTDFLNPILDRFHFWRGLEKLVYIILFKEEMKIC